MGTLPRLQRAAAFAGVHATHEEIDATVDPVENAFMIDLVQGGRMRLGTEAYGTVLLGVLRVELFVPEHVVNH